jgi:type IV pilus assembly protein PilM
MLGFGSSKAVIGLDVGSYAVKAVALQSNRDRITLQGYAQARIDNQDVAEVIRTVLGQLGVKASRVVTAVSGRSVIVRQVETPKLAEAELKAHIAYEADKYIPFGTEEVIIDAQPIPPRDGAQANTQHVMLVAVRKSFVQEHLAQLKTVHLLPEAIDVDVFALANAYELLGPPMPPDSERKAVALIDVGASKSNIAILQAGRVLFTREVYMAGNEISDAIGRTLNEQPEDVDRIKLAPGEALDAILDAAMSAFEDLANEIRLSFDYVEGQFEVEVANVVLTGGSSQLPNVPDILGNILGRPVHIFDPLAGLDLVPSKYDIHGLDANSPGLTVALGLAGHILDHQASGLGGQQSLAWQPRNRAVPAGGVAAAPLQADDETDPEEETQATAVTQFSAPVDAPPEPEQVYARPMAYPPPPPVYTPPPVEISADEGLDALDVENDPGITSGTGSVSSSGKHRSTLLVVLDEDQDMPVSERIERSSVVEAQRRATSSLVNPGRLDSASESSVEIKLPDLPKI